MMYLLNLSLRLLRRKSKTIQTFGCQVPIPDINKMNANALVTCALDVPELRLR
jgi:hypothetical protein